MLSSVDIFRILVVFACLFNVQCFSRACLSSLSCGMLFTWTSQAIPLIINDKVNYDISLEEASYFTVLPSIAMIISSLFVAKLTEVFGRKTVLYSVIVPQSIAWILIATASSIYQFYLARLITGISDATVFVTLPAYIGEVATPKVRGSWGNLITFSIYFGQFLVNIIGVYVPNISTAAYICLSVPIVMACTFIFMPETPYYYMIKNREEDAKRSLQQLLRKWDVDSELQILKKDVARQLSESGKWKDLFYIGSNRKALIAGLFLRTSQQFGGISCFSVYTQYIFQKSGTDIPASTATLTFMGIMLILNGVAGYTLDIFGRRKSYSYSLLLSGIVLLLMAIYFFLDDFTEVEMSFMNWFPVAGMISYVFVYSFGLGIVPTLMLGELFSASIKGKGLATVLIVFGTSLSVITKVFQLLETNFGLFSPFLLFAIACFISTVLALHFVPETKGKTLEEIQQSLKVKKPKKEIC